MGPETKPETPEAEAKGQAVGVSAPVGLATGEGTSPSGKRQALRDLRRELTEADLASPGVVKLLLDDLERADAECDLLRAYVPRFHDANTRAAVLQERLRRQTALEVAFGVGVGLGGVIIGFAPTLWGSPPLGVIALVVGLLLMLGGIVARAIKR